MNAVILMDAPATVALLDAAHELLHALDAYYPNDPLLRTQTDALSNALDAVRVEHIKGATQ